MMANEPTAMQLLERMFAVEMSFLQSNGRPSSDLAAAFHRDVVVREPASLPYAGDWRGLNGVATLFRVMKDTWSDMRVENLKAVRAGDTVFMSCALHMTARATRAAITQPFAEVLRFKDDLLIEGTPFYHDTAALVAAIDGGSAARGSNALRGFTGGAAI